MVYILTSLTCFGKSLLKLANQNLHIGISLGSHVAAFLKDTCAFSSAS